MGKGKFDKKQAVRFALVPGPEKDGKPTVLYKPLQTHKSRLSKKQRKDIVSQLSDYDEITINGRKVGGDQIPAYVLDQIRGRQDLLFNQMKGESAPHEEEEEGDLYDIQDAHEDDNQYEEYKDYEDELQLEKVEEGHDEGSNEEDWEDEDEEYDDEEEDGEVFEEETIEEPQKPQKFAHKEEDFPAIEQEKVQIDGVTYTLTKAQARLLETVIPEDYESLDFGGLNFKRYNEDGLLISEKDKYEKYILREDEKVVIIDSYQHVPTRPIHTVDNDFKPSQINSNTNVREVEDALEYDGEDQAYEQLEDDFFAKMIQVELQGSKPQTKQSHPKEEKPAKVKPVVQKQEKPVVKAETEQQLDQQLEKALFNFDHNIEESNKQQQSDEDSNEEEYEQGGNQSMNFTDLEKREEYIGRDGQLDWRCLTRKEKKEYMKTKVIREYYDELREREIQDKMKGKNNVAPEELHLKKLVKHIPYEEDHVMQKALQEDLKVKVDLNASSDDDDSFSSAEEDDIVSFHQKTSIIASNLSVIEEPRKKKVPKQPAEKQEEVVVETRVKVVPEQRSKNETKEERRERKEKLKGMKKEKREQKREFLEKFSKMKKETVKQENHSNPLSKVSYVKIY